MRIAIRCDNAIREGVWKDRIDRGMDIAACIVLYVLYGIVLYSII